MLCSVHLQSDKEWMVHLRQNLFLIMHVLLLLQTNYIWDFHCLQSKKPSYLFILHQKNPSKSPCTWNNVEYWYEQNGYNVEINDYIFYSFTANPKYIDT